MVSSALPKYIVAAFALLFLKGIVSVSSETIRHSRKETETETTATTNQDSNENNICLEQSNHPDRMTSFPGWDQPLPSAWYSGYLDYELEGQTVHTHYVLVQAEDHEGTEADDKPLLYWTNGGPGASSLFGLLTEIGPLMLSDESLDTASYKSTGIPTPIYNPYSWTRLGSILMIDQPAPVGFSYCNDDFHNASSHTCGGIAWTDELSSQNAYLALQAFFTDKFPCLVAKELYLTGESYGGIYVPTLARRIVEGNAKAKAAAAAAADETANAEETANNANSVAAAVGKTSVVAALNLSLDLKGFAVGDGCLGTHTSMCGGLGSSEGGFVDYWHLWFMAGHHQIPLADFRAVMKACSHSDEAGFLVSSKSKSNDNANVNGNTANDVCMAAMAMVKKEVGGFFEYALYDECTYNNGLKWKTRLGLHSVKANELNGALNDYPCGAGPVLEEYLALGDVVRDAFHVRSTFFEVDNAEGDFEYTPTDPDLEPFYKDMNGKLKILVYNGDTDPAITSFATQNWTSHLGFTELEDNGHWRPWTIDGCQKMGGYVERYEGGFDFLTIRGAGHMVPTYKPAASFAFLKAWLNDEDYPAFDVNCTQPAAPLPLPLPQHAHMKGDTKVDIEIKVQ